MVESITLAPQVVVQQDSSLLRLAFPVDRGLVPPRPADVPFEAVRGDVESAADEPLREGRLPIEDLRPGGDPLEGRGHPGPEGLGVLRGVRSEGIVSDCGVLPKARRGRVLFLLLEEAIYRCTGDDHARSPAVRPFSGRRWR